MKLTTLSLLFITAALTLGCSKKEPPPKPAPPVEQPAAAQPSIEPPPAPVTPPPQPVQPQLNTPKAVQDAATEAQEGQAPGMINSPEEETIPPGEVENEKPQDE